MTSLQGATYKLLGRMYVSGQFLAARIVPMAIGT